MNTPDTSTTERMPSPASPCSPFAAKHRANLGEEIKRAEKWIAALKEHLERDADDVIPWVNVECITDAATAIAYEAGMVNGARMIAYELPANDASERQRGGNGDA